MKTKTKSGKAIIVAFIVTMVALGSAQAGLDVQKGMYFFMLLSYITLGLSLSDVFLAQVLIRSEVGSITKGIEGIKKEMDNTTSLVLFELAVLVAFCLALLSLLFVIMSMA